MHGKCSIIGDDVVLGQYTFLWFVNLLKKCWGFQTGLYFIQIFSISHLLQ